MPKRRPALTAFFACVLAFAGGGNARSEDIAFRILLEQAQAQALPAELIDNSKVERIEGTQCLPVVLVIIAGTVALTVLADAVADLVWNLTKHGVTVDTRVQPVDIREHPSLSPRQIILVTKDRTEIITVSKREDIKAIIEGFVNDLHSFYRCVVYVTIAALWGGTCSAPRIYFCQWRLSE
jgi:hypothetical protein